MAIPVRALTLLAVVLLGFCATLAHCDTTYIYGITVDAGSSGSRIYIYKWPSRSNASLPIVQVVTNKKVSPGLSSFSTNIAGVPDHLKPLIDYAKANIPAASYSKTYMYLKATAGLRLLSLADQDAVMVATRNYLKTSPFVFQNSNARIISGSEEGLFAYITANFVKNQLLTNSGTGIMDLGGASTQIALDSTSGSPADTTTLKVEDKTHTIYAVSFLGLGKDQIVLAVKNNLIAKTASGGSVPNPCANPGYSEVFGSNVTLNGSGDFTACLGLIDNVTSTLIKASNTTLPKTDIAKTQFVAFSAYYYTAAFYSLVAPAVTDSKAQISQFLSAGKDFCGISWSSAQTKYPNETASILKDDCASAAMVVSLLRQYGLSDTASNVAFVSTIGSFEIGWQLGAMVYEANLLPIDTPIIAPSAPSNVTATTVTTTTVTLSWVAPENGGANITQYRIRGKPNNGNYTDVAATGSDKTTYTVTNLSPNTLYYYKVAAENSAGVGDYSAENSVKTASASTSAQTSVVALVCFAVAALLAL